MSNRFEAKDGIIVDNTGLMWMQEPLDNLFTWEEACAIKHSFGGFDDWRLPTIEELSSIIHYGRMSPSCFDGFACFNFDEKDKRLFWSSTPYVGISSYVWFVNFEYGYVDNAIQDYEMSVRLVRGQYERKI